MNKKQLLQRISLKSYDLDLSEIYRERDKKILKSFFNKKLVLIHPALKI